MARLQTFLLKMAIYWFLKEPCQFYLTRHLPLPSGGQSITEVSHCR